MINPPLHMFRVLLLLLLLRATFPLISTKDHPSTISPESQPQSVHERLLDLKSGTILWVFTSNELNARSLEAKPFLLDHKQGLGDILRYMGSKDKRGEIEISCGSIDDERDLCSCFLDGIMPLPPQQQQPLEILHPPPGHAFSLGKVDDLPPGVEMHLPAMPIVISTSKSLCPKVCVYSLGNEGEPGECFFPSESNARHVQFHEIGLRLGTFAYRVECGESTDYVVFEVVGSLTSNRPAMEAAAPPLSPLPAANRLEKEKKRDPREKPRIGIVTTFSSGGSQLNSLSQCELLSPEYTFVILRLIGIDDRGGANDLRHSFERCGEVVELLDLSQNSTDVLAMEHYFEFEFASSSTSSDALSGSSKSGQVLTTLGDSRLDAISIPYSPSGFYTTYLTLMARRLEVPVILELHNLPTHRVENVKKMGDVTVAPSNYVGSHDWTHVFTGGILPTVVAPVYVDAISTSTTPITTPQTDDDRKQIVIAIVGRLTSERMVSLALTTALKFAATSACDVSIHVVGDGPLRSALARLVEHYGASSPSILMKTTFHGSISPKSVSSLLRSIDATLVLNPCLETFGRAVVEANSESINVVACNGKAVNEIVESGVSGGFLADCSTSEGLLVTLQEAALVFQNRAQEWDAIRLEGHRRATEKFSKGAFIDGYRYVYEKALATNNNCDFGGSCGTDEEPANIDDIVIAAGRECGHHTDPGTQLTCIEDFFKSSQSNCNDSRCVNYLLARGCHEESNSDWNCASTVSSSAQHWETHYSLGGTSGEGSEGRVASYKRDVINQLISDLRIESVVEFGAGDGVLCSMINYSSYVGYDVSLTTISNLRSKFAGDVHRKFAHYGGEMLNPTSSLGVGSDLALSMEVIFHLVENDVYERYLTNLFNFSSKYVVVLSSNCEEDITLKDLYQTYRFDHGKGYNRGYWCSDPSAHVRHRHVVKDILIMFPQWKLKDVIEMRDDLKDASFSDFFVYERVNKNNMLPTT